MKSFLKAAIICIAIGVLGLLLHWQWNNFIGFICIYLGLYIFVMAARSWAYQREQSLSVLQMTNPIDPNGRYTPLQALQADAYFLLQTLATNWWAFKIKPDWIWKNFKSIIIAKR
jgi:hypothetical protein